MGVGLVVDYVVGYVLVANSVVGCMMLWVVVMSGLWGCETCLKVAEYCEVRLRELADLTSDELQT